MSPEACRIENWPAAGQKAVLGPAAGWISGTTAGARAALGGRLGSARAPWACRDSSEARWEENLPAVVTISGATAWMKAALGKIPGSADAPG